MQSFRDKYLKDLAGLTVLDVGSAKVRRNQPTYREIFEPDFKYFGMDIAPNTNVDIVGYANIPGTFDVVISGQVMEHIAFPWEWLKSLTKYFRKYICIIAPHTHGEHRFPIDTYRYFPDGMRALFEFAGIKEIEILKDRISTMGIGTQ